MKKLSFVILLLILACAEKDYPNICVHDYSPGSRWICYEDISNAECNQKATEESIVYNNNTYDLEVYYYGNEYEVCVEYCNRHPDVLSCVQSY